MGGNIGAMFNLEDQLKDSMLQRSQENAAKAQFDMQQKSADWKMRNDLNNKRGQLSGMFDSSLPRPMFNHQSPQGAYSTPQFQNFLDQLRLR